MIRGHGQRTFALLVLFSLCAAPRAAEGAVPGAPTIGTAAAAASGAIVGFTPPVSDGGFAITSYTVTSNPGAVTASAASSPIFLAGLTNGTSYTFTVTATNASGTGAASASSNSVKPQGIGISAGGRHSLALDSSGGVDAWGDDGSGQLGTGRVLESASPLASIGISGVKAIAAGNGWTLALKLDGTVWAWGDNRAGQLGDGTQTDRSSAVQVAGLSSVVAISAGGSHSVALKADGTVWTWGLNTFGQLGDGTTSDRPTPVVVAGLTGVVAIAAGGNHTIALRADGSVRAWGSNNDGQLGDGTLTNRSSPVTTKSIARISAIAAGHDHTLALRLDGSVWAWGNNFSGQLGDGTTSLRTIPVPVTGVAGATAIAAGGSHSAALLGDSSVSAWGDNFYGQLGDGTTTPRFAAAPVTGLTGVKAISVGYVHMVALLTGGTVRAWGGNASGQLGDGTTTNRSTSVAVTGFSGVGAIAAGYDHTAALKTNGSLWAWGDNFSGQLGDGAPTTRSIPVAVSGLAGAAAIAAGASHSVAALTDGTVWAWGNNLTGQLGDGTTTDRSTPVQVSGLTNVIAVAAGAGHTVALKRDGRVWTWGDNGSGQLGDGTNTARLTPVLVTALSNVVAIAAGANHTIAVKGDGSVWVWGYNNFGQLCDGTMTQRSNPIAVGGLTNVVSIAGGFYFTVASKKDGSVWGCGHNASGQLGDGSQTDRGTPVAAGLTGVASVSAGGSFVGGPLVEHTVAMKTDGSVWAWGDNSFGQLGDTTTTRRLTPVAVSGLASGAIAISAGGDHTASLKSDSTVLSWGYNFYGQLGDGTRVSRSRPAISVAEGGAGTLDTNDWYLHLDPSLAATPAGALVPKTLVITQVSGSGALNGTVKYQTHEFGQKKNNYVLGLVPPQFFSLVKSTPGSAQMAKSAAKDGGFVVAQLTPNGWSVVLGSLDAFSQNTATGAGGLANVLDSVPLSSLPDGTKFCIGYGDSAQSMLGDATLRTLVDLGSVVSSESGTPCLLPSVYLDGQTSSLLNSSVTFNATVVGATPTGSVQFRDGADNLGSAQALTSSNSVVSKASISPSLPVGVHSIGATYSGDGNNPWGPTTYVAPVVHEVTAPPSGVSVELTGDSSSEVNVGATFIARVVANDLTGTVQFKDGGNNLGAPAILVAGTTTLRTSSLTLGTHTITAVYSGPPSATTSNAVTHTVYDAITTQVALTSSANPSSQGAALTLTATVSGNGPTGTVTFRDRGTILANQVALSNGAASHTLSSLAEGVHEVTATYSGDGNNQTVTSATLQQQVGLPSPNPARLFNISTRGQVLTGNDVMIAGLIVGGSSSKTVVVSVAGPSLANAGITNPLANPTLTLVRSSDNAVIAVNDDWQNQSAANVAALQTTGLQPNHPLEPAIIATLAPGNYTAIVTGVGGGTGVGLVGVFEVDHPEVPLFNISTRGQVLTGNDVMIAGFIIQGSSALTVVVNVAGPSLANAGITNPLANPTLTLVRASDNAVIAVNDDWQNQSQSNVAAIQNSGLQPNNPLEPAIIATLAPGAYTAIVSGVGGGTGVGLIGVFTVP